MTEWELQQVTDTLVMARDRGLMPTISNMLIALSDERTALLKAAKAYVEVADREWPADHPVRDALDAAIVKAES